MEKHDETMAPGQLNGVVGRRAVSDQFEFAERKLLEITASSSGPTRFSVGYWMPDGWHMEDCISVNDRVEDRGYRVVTIYDLPQKTELRKDA